VPYYESVFLVRPDVSAQQVEALAQSFNDAVSEKGGSITKVEHWGLRNLAYRIKKNRKAYYVLFNIDAPASAVHDLERTMRLSEDVLRSMTIRVDALEEGPSAMMQSKSRDDRPRRDRDRHRDGDKAAVEKAADEKATDEKATDEKATDEKATDEKATEAPTEKAPADSSDAGGEANVMEDGQ
jgi:small subunit ribosomal protein S6